MRDGSFLFSRKWALTVKELKETGMGYTVVSITLADGRKFDQVIINSGYLSRVRGLPDVPFKEDDIIELVANHLKWDWNENP